VTVIIRLWDIAGQKCQRSLAGRYSRNVEFVLPGFTLNSPFSFTYIANGRSARQAVSN
jgi:hypothetical protein